MNDKKGVAVCRVNEPIVMEQDGQSDERMRTTQVVTRVEVIGTWNGYLIVSQVPSEWCYARDYNSRVEV